MKLRHLFLAVSVCALTLGGCKAEPDMAAPEASHEISVTLPALNG